MGIVLAIVKETIDATIDGDRQLFRNDVPLVVAFNIEETALIIRIGLCLIEVTILTNIFLQVAVAVDAVLALQLRRETRGIV